MAKKESSKPTKSDLRAKLATLSNEPVQGALLEVLNALIENSSLEEKAAEPKPEESKPEQTAK